MMRMHKLVMYGGVVSLALVPYPTLVAPQWEVTVRDERGAALDSILVRETYQDYSAQLSGGEEDRYTDHLGHVVFPSKQIWVSSLKRLVAFGSSAMAFARASFGPHDHILAFSGALSGEPVKNGVIEDWTGSPGKLNSVIVLNGTNSQ